MSLTITETFGYQTVDSSEAAVAQRRSLNCPFTNQQCWKRFRSGGVVNGTCVVKPPTSAEVIVCPDRLYADNFKILGEVAVEAFGRKMTLIGANDVASTSGQPN